MYDLISYKSPEIRAMNDLITRQVLHAIYDLLTCPECPTFYDLFTISKNICCVRTVYNCRENLQHTI